MLTGWKPVPTIVAAALLLAAIPAAAATLTINPTRFTASSTEMKHLRTPTAITVHADNVGGYGGWAFFTLPAGSVITGGAYFHWSGSGVGSRCYVYREKKNPTTNASGELLLSGSSYADTGDYINVPLQLSPDGDRKVKSTYVYHVYIGVDKGAGLGPVRIFYQPPSP